MKGKLSTEIRPRRKFPPWLSVLLLLVSVGILVYGFLYYDRSFDYDSLPEGWVIIHPPEDVHAMALRGDTIWVGGKEGVFHIDRTRKILTGKLETDPPLEYIRALLVDDQGKLYIGHANGLTIYNGNNFILLDETDGLPDVRVNSIIRDSSGNILIGTWKGAVWLKGDTLEMLNNENDLLDIMINVMMKGSDGTLWFGSYTAPRGGITIMKNGQAQYFSKDNGLPHNNITSISEDLLGNVWVGTGLYKRGGAARFICDGGVWQMDSVLTENHGLAGEKVRSVFQDRNGYLWFGSEYDGLTIFSEEFQLVLSEKSGLSHPEVKCIAEDKDGNIWLGTRKGVTNLAPAIVDSLIASARK